MLRRPSSKSVGLGLCLILSWAQAIGATPEDSWERLLDRTRTLAAQENYPEATEAAERALQIAEKNFEEEEDPRLADSLDLLAQQYLSQNRLSEAEPLLKRALAIQENLFGENHFTVAETLILLGDLHLAQNQPALAEPLYRRALAIREKMYGREDPRVADTLVAVVQITVSGKQAGPQAASLVGRALKIREKALGSGHPVVADTLMLLAKIYIDQGQPQQAESLLKKALSIRKQSFGQAQPIVADTLMILAELYLTQGEPDLAESLYNEAVSIRKKTHGPTDPIVVDTLILIASTHSNLGRHEKAQTFLDQARSITRETRTGLQTEKGGSRKREKLQAPSATWDLTARIGPSGDRALTVARSLGERAEVYLNLGRQAEAITMFHQSLDIYEKVVGLDHEMVQEVLEKYVGLLVQVGRSHEADRLLKRVPPPKRQQGGK